MDNDLSLGFWIKDKPYIFIDNEKFENRKRIYFLRTYDEYYVYLFFSSDNNSVTCSEYKPVKSSLVLNCKKTKEFRNFFLVQDARCYSLFSESSKLKMNGRYCEDPISVLRKEFNNRIDHSYTIENTRLFFRNKYRILDNHEFTKSEIVKYDNTRLSSFLTHYGTNMYNFHMKIGHGNSYFAGICELPGLAIDCKHFIMKRIIGEFSKIDGSFNKEKIIKHIQNTFFHLGEDIRNIYDISSLCSFSCVLLFNDWIFPFAIGNFSCLLVGVSSKNNAYYVGKKDMVSIDYDKQGDISVLDKSLFKSVILHYPHNVYKKRKNTKNASLDEIVYIYEKIREIDDLNISKFFHDILYEKEEFISDFNMFVISNI